jgi:hypothetical protein
LVDAGAAVSLLHATDEQTVTSTSSGSICFMNTP